MGNDQRERWGCGPRAAWGRRRRQGGWRPGADRPRHFLFVRFAFVFGLLALLVVGAASILTYVITAVFGRTEHLAARPLAWAGWLLLALLLPMLAVRVGHRASRRITAPLEGVMQAAETVAGGDLSVRVPEYGPGEFSRLAESFNHMVAELERADTQRRNLTADVAHELRTPLHIIQGNLEGILDGVYQPSPEHIEATLDEARGLARLVEDLRTLSLAEAGQLTLARDHVDVAELLDDARTSFSGQAEAAGVTLEVDVRGDPAALSVTGDAGRLDQVLGNLLANALRHTGAGGSIKMSAEGIDNRVRIGVSDTGEGIAAEDLPYIFDRFWRGDRSYDGGRSHAGGAGSGLGLAIARQLVQAHGGRIGVSSQVGKGTTFRIELPQAGHGRS